MTAKNSVLQLAESFDSKGNHDEAVNVLARATKGGDLVAMTTLGKRLLVGDRSPYLPKDGASMVLEAANKGNLEAVAQVAVFQCTGIYQEKNWSHALNSLSWSARGGWGPAREQLLLLSGQRLEDFPVALKNADDEYWKSLSESFDLQAWLTIDNSEILSDSPLIKSFKNFIPHEICKRLIQQSKLRLQPALVYDPLGKRNIRYKTRTNSIAQFNLVENDVIHFLLQERMSAACGIPMTQMEATAILNYQPGEEITDHYDFVDPEIQNYDQEIAENGQRIITFLIYLNDQYSEGETNFPELGLCHRGELGEGIYFTNALADGSADLRTLHAGKPPVEGEKWIVSQFVRSRAVKYVID